MSLMLTALLSNAMAGPVGFDRVDLISEDPGTWINYEVSTFGTYPTRPILRFVTQVKPVWTTPWEGITVGTSIESQSVVYEAPLLADQGISWSAGLQTKLLMPRGVTAGLAWRGGNFRVGLGVSAVSESTWARPGFRSWTILPTLGVGIGPKADSGQD